MSVSALIMHMLCMILAALGYVQKSPIRSVTVSWTIDALYFISFLVSLSAKGFPFLTIS